MRWSQINSIELERDQIDEIEEAVDLVLGDDEGEIKGTEDDDDGVNARHGLVQNVHPTTESVR